MPDCVFCKIAQKKIAAEVVYEDNRFLAFLDTNPQSPGHCQVIPKEHFRWVWDLPDGRQTSPNIGEYFEVARKIALAQKKAFNQEMIWAKVMGDEIEHAHIWIFPHPATPGDKTDLAGNAQKIRARLTGFL